jgi:Cyclin-dependent kinase regulatory subunit
MSSSRIEYSEKYADDNYEYRYETISPQFLRRERFAAAHLKAFRLHSSSLVIACSVMSFYRKT